MNKIDFLSTFFGLQADTDAYKKGIRDHDTSVTKWLENHETAEIIAVSTSDINGRIVTTIAYIERIH